MSSCQLNQCENRAPDEQLLPNNLVKCIVGRLQSVHSENDAVSGVNPPIKKKPPAPVSQGCSGSKLLDDRLTNGSISRGDVAMDGRVPPVPTPRRKKVESMQLSSTDMQTFDGDSVKHKATKSVSVNGGSYKVVECDNRSESSESQLQVNKMDNEGFKSQLQQLLITQAKSKLDSASVTLKSKPPNKYKHKSSGTFLPLPPKPLLRETIHTNYSSKQVDNCDILPSKVHSSSQADGQPSIFPAFCEPPKGPIAGCFGNNSNVVPKELSETVEHEAMNQSVKPKQSSISLTKELAEDVTVVITKVYSGELASEGVPDSGDRALHDVDSSSLQPAIKTVASKPLPMPRSPVSPPQHVVGPPPLVPRKPVISAEKSAIAERRLPPPNPVPPPNITLGEIRGDSRKPLSGNSVIPESKSVSRVGITVGKVTNQLPTGPKPINSSIGSSRSLIDLRPSVPENAVKASQSLRTASTTSRDSFDSDDDDYEDVSELEIPFQIPQRVVDDETHLNEIYECLTPNLANLNSIFDDESEPLYQVYHHNAVVRQVVMQNTDYVDDDSDYVEYETHFRNYILQKNSQDFSTKASENLDELAQEESAFVHSNEVPASSGVYSTQRSSYKRLWCEMPSVKDSDVLQSMSNDERRLQESQFELISSEHSYLRSMNIVINHFMAAFSTSFDQEKELSYLERDDFNRLFSNSRAIRVASAKLACALEKLWTSSCIIDPAALGRTIAEVAQPDFDVYVIYCSNAMYQDRKLRELLEHNVEFQTSLSRLEKASCCQSLPLASFLTLPMQRITRYPLLISAVCRSFEKARSVCVPNELSNCLSILQKIVDRCNEGARKMSNLEQMMEIHKVIDFKACQGLPLISESRFFVKKGPLVQLLKPSPGFFKKTKRTLHFYLFNDILLITKKKSLLEKRFIVFEHCSRANVHAEVISEDEVPNRLMLNTPSGTISAKNATTASVSAGYRNTFSLTLMDKNVEFILSADSPSERERWVQAFSPPVSEDDDERIYESWDCPQVQAVTRHVAREPDELSFEESDIISVFRKLSDGWYEGERIRDGRRGWFQSEYTVEVQNEHVRARNLREQYQLKFCTPSSS